MPKAGAAEKTLAPESPTELIHRLHRGDETAWRMFLDSYGERLRRYLLVVARGDFAGADEAWQDCLQRVASNLKSFDSDEAFWRWLCRVARTAWLDRCRRQGRYRSMLERFREYRLALNCARDGDAEARLADALECALVRLGEADGALLRQKYFVGTSVRELAREANVSEKAIESRLTRARQRLRKLLEAEMHS
ncbi:MAG: RNA polymerase sigma factor [Opitutales bacterium]